MKTLLKTVTVKASDVHYNYVSSMNDYMSDMALDQEDGITWNSVAKDMDLLKSAVSGNASVERLQGFFQDGNTMMALPNVMSEMEDFFHKQKGKEDDIALVITDEVGKTLYIIPGKFLKY